MLAKNLYGHNRPKSSLPTRQISRGLLNQDLIGGVSNNGPASGMNFYNKDEISNSIQILQRSHRDQSTENNDSNIFNKRKQ